MGEARQIGAFISPILRRIETMYHLQQLLELVDAPRAQKAIILTSRDAGAVADHDAALLISAFRLEEA